MAETPNARVACGACGHIEECHLGAGSRCLVCGCGALVPPRAEPPSPTPAERERWREEAEGYAACGTLMSQRFAQRILALLDAVERLAAERDQYERTGRILADTLHVTSEEHDALRAALGRAERERDEAKRAHERDLDAGGADLYQRLRAAEARVAQLDGEAAGLAHALTEANEELEHAAVAREQAEKDYRALLAECDAARRVGDDIAEAWREQVAHTNLVRTTYQQRVKLAHGQLRAAEADRTALRARVAQLEGEAAGLAHALTTAGEERERLVAEKKAARQRAEKAEQAWRDRGGMGSRPV
jgi:chromosome segregation ATPase